MSDFIINPLLAYSQHNLAPQSVGGPFPCPLFWDMRDSTESAHLINESETPLDFTHLAQFATQPPIESIDITCGFFISEWPITVHRTDGVTVGDVLDAIYITMRRRISHAEWDSLAKSVQDRIRDVFNERWQAADDSDECRQNGVLRIDCLLQHTVFGGLSVSPDREDSCILSLRRVR